MARPGSVVPSPSLATGASIYFDFAAGLVLGSGCATGLHSAVVATALEHLEGEVRWLDDESEDAQ